MSSYSASLHSPILIESQQSSWGSNQSLMKMLRVAVLSVFMALYTVTFRDLAIAETISNSSEARRPTVFGWLEKVRVSPGELVVHAKLDSGADTSSMHVRNLKSFEKEGAPWVSFTLRNRYGKQQEIKLPVVRWARIKKGSDQRIQERVVVLLKLCLGREAQEVEVNLVDRSHMNYPLLIGRGFLAGTALVDSARTYLTEPTCK